MAGARQQSHGSSDTFEQHGRRCLSSCELLRYEGVHKLRAPKWTPMFHDPCTGLLQRGPDVLDTYICLVSPKDVDAINGR